MADNKKDVKIRKLTKKESKKLLGGMGTSEGTGSQPGISCCDNENCRTTSCTGAVTKSRPGSSKLTGL